VAIENDFKIAHQIFKKKLFRRNGSSNACDIHDLFKKLHPSGHNCLGCNFDENLYSILLFLERHKKLQSVQFDMSEYIIKMYLFYERASFVCDILKVPESYTKKHFKSFRLINRWANFIKHPKAFILTHHSIFDYEDSGLYNASDYELVINESFIDTYYKGQSDIDKQRKNNNDLYLKIRNKKNILVVFPNVIKITEKFCYAAIVFFNIIKDNPIYIEILNDEATLVDYFENQSN
jgi:hypothetical protein